MLVRRRAHLARQGPADLLESWKIPQIGEVTALLRLDFLHDAISPIEKSAFAVWVFVKGETAPIGSESRIVLDEIEFAQTEVFGHATDLLIADTHLPRPATAGRAAVAFVKDRHDLAYPIFGYDARTFTKSQ